jgi:hypothetical protein
MKARIFFIWMILITTISVAQENDSVDYSETSDQPAENQSDENEYTDDAEATNDPVLVAPQELKSTQQYKEEKIPVKKFDKKKWKEVVGSANYDDRLEKPKPRKENNFQVPSAPWGGPILRLISYIVIIGVIIALLYFVLRNVSLDLKIRKETIAGEDAMAPVENIEELDTEALLKRALADGNVKLAVRLYYLQLLQKLNANGIIIWKKDKTNRDYLAELFSRQFFYDEVRKLTLAYELVWYGERVLTPESFQSLVTAFESMKEKLNTPAES